MENSAPFYRSRNNCQVSDRIPKFTSKHSLSNHYGSHVLHDSNRVNFSSIISPPKKCRIQSIHQPFHSQHNSRKDVVSRKKTISSHHYIKSPPENNYQYTNKEIVNTLNDIKFNRQYNTRTPVMPRKNSIVLVTERSPLNSDNFQVIKLLGKGKYGNVYLVYDKITGFIMALKSISKKIIKQKDLKDQIIRQIKIQSYLKHPGAIQLYGIFHDYQNLYMLMELGCDGQLFDLIQKKKILKEETNSFLARNLLEVTDYIHKEKVFHRDLKPENIVLVLGNPKICDFGWSIYVGGLDDDKMRDTFCGTPLYFSPELLMRKKYDEKIDLWAIGVMIYEFTTGQSPFGLKKPEDLQKIITSEVRYRMSDKCPPYFRQFINRCLAKNPAYRSSSEQLLKLWFIKKYSQLEICQQFCCGRGQLYQ